MSSLPTDALAAARFLFRHMYRRVAVTADTDLFAFSENPSAEDLWFWSDDNAKILEFLSRPEVWRQFPQETGEVLRFVRAMCHGPFIFRRVSSPRLEPAGQQSNISRYCHSLMWIKHDLPNGAVGAALRYHDERNADHLVMAGHRVEFTYRGKRFRRLVAPGIQQFEATQSGDVLTLRHSGDRHFKPFWQELRLGRITYLYRIDARSMLIDVEVVFEVEPGIRISDVVLTVVHDNLGFIDYSSLVTDQSAVAQPLFEAGRDTAGTVSATGASYYMIRQRHVSGDAVAIHTLCQEPATLSAFEVSGSGKLEQVVAQYAFPGDRSGERLTVRECKLLTGGGFYHRVGDYVGFLRDAVATRHTQRAARDLSISYDYGVTINAFAKCFATCHAETSGLDLGVSSQELQSLFDEYSVHYSNFYLDRHWREPNAIFSRELAFVLLATLTMQRATGAERYRTQVRRLCDVLLDFEFPFDDGGGRPVSGFLMRKDSPRAAFVDCHSAALLALTQAARLLDDERLLRGVDRGLAAYGVETHRGGGGTVDTVGTIMLDEHGTPSLQNAFWNFKAGVTLRFFTALRDTKDSALQAIAARHGDRIQLFERLLRDQLERSGTLHGDEFEMRCCAVCQETNSETQPWVMLGLLGHPHD